MVTKNETGLYEVEVDGAKYEFEKWGADEALDVLLQFVPLVGKPLGTAVAAFMGEEKGIDAEIDPNMIGLIVDALTSNFDKKTIKSLFVKLSSEKVLCDGKKFSFNTHYQDRLDHMFKVVQAALEVQYGNFFAALLGMFGKFTPKAFTNRAPQT